MLDRLPTRLRPCFAPSDPDYVKIRYDLPGRRVRTFDALALGDSPGIAARTGYSVIVAGIEEGNSISPRVQDSFL